MRFTSGGVTAAQGKLQIIAPKAFVPVADVRKTWKKKSENSAGGGMLRASEPGRFVVSPSVWLLSNIPGARKVKVPKVPLRWALFEGGKEVRSGNFTADKFLLIVAPEAMNRGLALVVKLMEETRPVEFRMAVRFYPDQAPIKWDQYFRSP